MYEQIRSDVEMIAMKYPFSTGQRQLLERNVMGTYRPNRDTYLWGLATVLSALLQCRSRHPGYHPVKCAQDAVLTGRAELKRHCEGHDGVRLSDDGMAVDLPGLKFRRNWATIDNALAFGDFFVEGDNGILYGAFAEAVTNLDKARDTAAGVKAAVGTLSSRIGQWRRRRFPLEQHQKLMAALLGFLNGRRQSRPGTGIAFDDDDILAYWCQCLESCRNRGRDRMMFATAAKYFRDFERAQVRWAAVRGVSAPDDIDALDGRTDLEPACGDGWHHTEDEDAERRLADAVDSLVSDPKALKGTEADAIKDLIKLWPFFKTRPLTMLRVLAFGPVQSGISNRLRRDGGGEDIQTRITCESARSYATVVADYEQLLEHLDSLRRIATAVRLAGVGPQQMIDMLANENGNYDAAEMSLQVSREIQQGISELRRLRRQGFNRPIEELAAVFATDQKVEMLINLRNMVGDFMVELLQLRGQAAHYFEQDKMIFSDVFARAYGGEC
jgi:hypothetical protein